MTFGSMGCEVVVEGGPVDEIRALFERYDATFSSFRADSELSRLNRAGGGRMSPLFAEVLDRALWAARVTGGLVVPGAVRRVGRVLLLRGSLDLNGVVKSIAVDRAAALLSADGFVSAGGDIATRGPVDVALTGGAAVRVTGGIATSGVTRRGCHLIDPATRLPSSSPWLEVTVCGATCVDADVAAKAAFLSGAEGPHWLDERGLPGRFVGPDGVVVNRRWESACT